MSDRRKLGIWKGFIDDAADLLVAKAALISPPMFAQVTAVSGMSLFICFPSTSLPNLSRTPEPVTVHEFGHTSEPESQLVYRPTIADATSHTTLSVQSTSHGHTASGVHLT